MKSVLQILIVEDSEDDALLILHQIKNGGYEIYYECVETSETFITALNSKNWDIILSDYTMPQFNGLKALLLLKESGKEIPFIIVSGVIGEEVAVEAMKTGASDYVMKNNLQRLLPAVERELRESKSRARKRLLEQEQKQAEKELKDSEARYRLLFESTREGLISLDPDGRIVTANPAAAKILGYDKPRDLVGMKTVEFYADIKQREFVLKELEAKGYIEDFEFIFKKRDGKKLYVLVSITIQRNDNGDYIRSNAIFRDITEQKRAENTLKETNARHSAMIENIGDVIAIMGADGRIKYQSPNTEKWFGWKPEEIIGINSWDNVHPDDLERIQKEFSKMVEKKTAGIFELRLRCKDGTYNWIELTGINRFDDPAIKGALLNYHVITERKQAEAALHESEARYRLLFEASADGIQIVDIETKMIKYVNPAQCRMLGYTAEELAKLRLDEIHPKRDMQWIIAEFESVISEDKVLVPGIPCLRKDGSIVYADIHTAKIIIEDRPHNMGIFRDITERKRIDDELKKYRENLEEHTKNLELEITERKRVENALQETNARHSAMIEKIGDVIAIIGADGIAKYQSPNIEKWFGWKLEDLFGKNGFEFVHPEDVERIQKVFIDILEKEKNTMTFEYRFRCKDGTYKWIEVTAVNRFNDPVINGVLLNSHDITERKKAEEALKQAHDNTKTILDNSPFGVVVLGRDRKIRWVNKSAMKMAGFENDDVIIGKDCKDFLCTADQDECPILDKGQTLDNSERILRRYDGKEIPIIKSVNEINFNNENVLLETFIDITERKQAEAALHESEARYRSLFEASADGIQIVDIETKMLKYANPALCQMLGYSAEEIAKLRLEDMHPKQDMPRIMTEIRGNKTLVSDIPCLKKDGSIVFVDIHTANIIIDDRQCNMGIFRDITERKRIEEEIKLKNEQLIKVNAEKDKFFSIIAHDLRGPLGSLMGFTEILVNELPTLTMNEIQEFALVMRNSAANLFSFIENLLQWARQEQGLIPFKPTLLQLLPVVNNSMAIVREAAKTKDIEIDSDIPDDIMVFADENMLQTVIRNLVTNAIKFTPQLGKISLLARKTDEKSIEIAIKDTGIGMNSKMLNNLFLISAKINRLGTDGEPSSGLGLLLCKEFIEKHGGKIWVESEVKDLSAGIVGGTTIYFTINDQP